MAKEINASNVLDGVVREIDTEAAFASVAIDVGGGNIIYSNIKIDALGKLDLKNDEHIKVIFPGSSVVLAPAGTKYTFSSPNLLKGKVGKVDENFVTIHIGDNEIVANFQPEKTEWKTGDEVRAIVRPDDVLLARESAQIKKQ